MLNNLSVVCQNGIINGDKNKNDYWRIQLQKFDSPFHYLSIHSHSFWFTTPQIHLPFHPISFSYSHSHSHSNHGWAHFMWWILFALTNDGYLLLITTNPYWECNHWNLGDFIRARNYIEPISKLSSNFKTMNVHWFDKHNNHMAISVTKKQNRIKIITKITNYLLEIICRRYPGILCLLDKIRKCSIPQRYTTLWISSINHDAVANEISQLLSIVLLSSLFCHTNSN